MIIWNRAYGVTLSHGNSPRFLHCVSETYRFRCPTLKGFAKIKPTTSTVTRLHVLVFEDGMGGPGAGHVCVIN